METLLRCHTYMASNTFKGGTNYPLPATATCETSAASSPPPLLMFALIAARRKRKCCRAREANIWGWRRFSFPFSLLLVFYSSPSDSLVSEEAATAVWPDFTRVERQMDFDERQK